jgi:hypothetical protein
MIKLMNLEYIQDPRSIEDVSDEVIIGSAEPPLLPRHIHCCNYLFPHRQNFFFFLFFFTSPHFFCAARKGERLVYSEISETVFPAKIVQFQPIVVCFSRHSMERAV